MVKKNLDHISPRLRPLAVPLRSLHADDHNARKHNRRNLEAIAESLKAFGQQAPVVYVERDGKRVVIKGNGLLAAAQSLHWRHVAAVRSDLEGEAVRAYAIADNRTAELSEWDDAVLEEQLAELAAGMKFSLAGLGFSQGEIDDLARRSQQDVEHLDAQQRAQPVKPITIERPPCVTWILVGVPTVRFFEVNDLVEQLSSVEGAIVKIKVQDDRSLRPADKQYGKDRK